MSKATASENRRTLDVVNNENQKVGSVDVSDEVFGGRVKVDLIHESVMRANAAERRGTHATKNRARSAAAAEAVAAEGHGPCARRRSRNPLWRKGGTVFGPQPRSYEYQLPKKVEKGALRAALASKLQGGDVIVVDALRASEIKTKAAAGLLRTLGVDGKALLVDVQPDEKFALSVRNVPGVRPAAEQPGHGARRHGHAQGGGDAGRAREAAGSRCHETDMTHSIARSITEKTTILREDGRTMVFEVARDANKIDVRQAVEKLLGAKVADVRTANAQGKLKRQGRFVGRRNDWKKAYVKRARGREAARFPGRGLGKFKVTS
jgi:large subunit ribosomal protein L4